MNIRLGEMSASEAIALANSSYAKAKASGNQAFVAQEKPFWDTVLSAVLTTVTPRPATYASAPAPQAPSIMPYAIAGGAVLAALVFLK